MEALVTAWGIGGREGGDITDPIGRLSYRAIGKADVCVYTVYLPRPAAHTPQGVTSANIKELTVH